MGRGGGKGLIILYIYMIFVHRLCVVATLINLSTQGTQHKRGGLLLLLKIGQYLGDKYLLIPQWTTTFA